MTSTTIFKLPYGLKEGNLVSVNEVERGLACNCVCPNCKSPLIANKGEQKSHYFSHKGKLECNGETLLHSSGKLVLIKRLRETIKNQETLLVQWNCQHCHGIHQGNLVKKAKYIKEEVSFGDCRPDIVLFDDNKALAFIEIVVTHSPDEVVFKYCKQNGVALLIFQINGFEDLESLEESPLLPQVTLPCIAPKCCNISLVEKNYYIFDVDCKKCGRAIKAALLKIGHEFIMPADFSRNDLEFARKQGVCILKKTDKMKKGSYNAITCNRCGRYIGNSNYHYLALGSYTKPVTSCYFCTICGKHYAK